MEGRFSAAPCVSCYARAVAAKKRKAPSKKEIIEIYDPEVMYPFWKLAGGNLSEAMRLAGAANETRVPSRIQTWSEYADRYNFRERFRAEEKRRWADFHAEREEKQQQILDKVAGTFEIVFDFFAESTLAHIDTLKGNDKDKQRQSRAALMKMFGSMEAVDRFYRMYLRARGQPEKITKNEHSGEIATPYRDLEDKPKAKSPDEAKRLADQDESGRS